MPIPKIRLSLYDWQGRLGRSPGDRTPVYRMRLAAPGRHEATFYGALREHSNLRVNPHD